MASMIAVLLAALSPLAAATASATLPEPAPRESSFAGLPSHAFDSEDECHAAGTAADSDCALSALQLRGSAIPGTAPDGSKVETEESAATAEHIEAETEAIAVMSHASEEAEAAPSTDPGVAAALTHEEASATEAEAVTVVTQAAEVEAVSVAAAGAATSAGKAGHAVESADEEDGTVKQVAASAIAKEVGVAAKEDEFERDWMSSEEDDNFGYEDDAEAVDVDVQAKHPMERDLEGEDIEPEEGYYSVEDEAEEDSWGSWASVGAGAGAMDGTGSAAAQDAEEVAGPKNNVSGALLLELTPVDKVPITGCHGENGTACPLGETCITKYDGTWSQCFSCSRATFGQECQKLDDYMRYAAVRNCKQTCLDQRCFNRNWCFKPYRCIVDHQEQWGQCISCTSRKYWQNSCYASKAGLKHIASTTCHRSCGH